MQTIIVLLNPGMLENADLDLRYRIPDRIEEVSNERCFKSTYLRRTYRTLPAS